MVSHLIQGSRVMCGIKTRLIDTQALGGAIHRKARGDTIISRAGRHQQIGGKPGFLCMGQLVSW